MKYDFLHIEKKWQEYWEREKTFRVLDHEQKPKPYVLDMFPIHPAPAFTSAIRKGIPQRIFCAATGG